MTELSVGEILIAAISAVLALASWIGTAIQLKRFRQVLPGQFGWALLVTATVCLLFVLLTLRTLASHDVREDPAYITIYGLMGAAWIGVSHRVFLPGISLRDDFFERENDAAAIAVLGFVLGSTFCFSGANIGDGPGWWVVVVCALLANGALALLWIVADGVTNIADKITIDRDSDAAFRAAGLFVGGGLVFGNAVAGDWQNVGMTLRDFAVRCWPALLILAAFVFNEIRAIRSEYSGNSRLNMREVWSAIVFAAMGLLLILAQRKIP